MADKPLLNRAFTTREKGLILVLVAVSIIALYYFVVVQSVSNAKAEGEDKLADLQSQIAVEQTLASSRSAMQNEIEKLGDVTNLPKVATYDNIRNEFNMLNGIFQDSESYTLTFQDPQLSGSTVRREAKISFVAGSYDEAYALIDALEVGPYRCQVDDVSMTGKIMADGSIGSVSVNLGVTFFETTDGAATLSGLQDSSSSSKSSSSSASSGSVSATTNKTAAAIAG